MSIEQIIVLALIQGITEFLPISSSGHLILVPALTGWADQGVVTDMVTNLGTLAAVIIYFWRDVVHMFWGTLDVVRRKTTQNSKLALHILIGTIPIIIVGLLLNITHLDEHIPAVLSVLGLFTVFRAVVVVRRVFFGKPEPTNISRLSSDEVVKARSKLLGNRNRSSV